MAKKRAYAEWGRQPIGPVGIEYDHARAEGLVFFAPLSGAHGTRDLVQEQLGVRTGLEAYLPSQAGALHHLFGSSSYVDFPVLPAVGHTTPTTIAWTQEPRSTSTYSAVLWIKPTGATYGFAIYESAADSAYYFVVGRRNPTGGGVDVSTFSANVGAVTNDRLDRFVLTLPSGMTSGGGARLWRNGVEVAAGTSLLSNEFSTNTTAAFRVGALESGGDPFEGLIGDMRIWSRVLPDGDAEDESTVPGGWKLYAKSRILVPVSAGGSTLTATLIEATAGTDLASASAVLSASLLDAAAGTDITSAQPTVARSLVDAAGGVDLVNSGVVVNGTLVEGVSAVDLSSALATLSVTVNEAVTVVELLAATRIANVAATEAAAGVDISSTGTSLSGSLVDAVVSADALSAAATLVASVLEAGGVVDQIHAAAQLVVLLTESAAGSDVVSRPAVYSVTATELVAALDVLSAAIEAAGLDPSARFTIAAKARRLTITAAARRLEIRK